MFKKISSAMMALCLVCLTAAGCGQSGSGSGGSAAPETAAQTQAATEATTAPAITTKLPKTDMTKWKLIPDTKVYYQTDIVYCEKPAAEEYAKLTVFVPAAYMDATDNGDGTYTCKLNRSAAVNGYTASTAPIVMPIETPGYYAAEPLNEQMITGYPKLAENVSGVADQGFVCVFAGCRGIDEGAPAGVTDLKAAIRYVRYCDDVIAGDAERIFVFGMSGGGAQAAILGASGDSELYDPYLEAIGAVQGVSDAVAGSMDWCPVTDLDTANAEYEWMMGCTRPERSAQDKALSDHLAVAFAEYVNSAGFTDKDGNALTLTETKEGIYQAGSYYDYIKGVIETSLNHYLSDTAFSGENLHNSYGSAENYVNDLNKDGKWVTYDAATNTATITSIADFAKACKKASSNLVAFDTPPEGTNLFGFGDRKGVHFDKILTDVMTDLNYQYASAYSADLAKTDSVGNTVLERVEMYTPLYYLMKSREGYGKSTVAKYWRIRTGIEQQNTSLTTEVNLALALEHCEGVESVDFETVWAQGHTEAERKGTGTENFIEWVNACMKG